MIERLKVRRELSELSSFKIEFQKSLSLSFMRSWFKLLSNDLRSVVKTSCFEFVMHSLSFESLSKSKMFIKIKCELFNNTTEEHIVRKKSKKLQTENYVFLSYDFEKKSSHLNEKYEKISNSVNIIFATDLQTSKKKNTIARQMTTNQKSAIAEWNQQMREWIFKRLMWKYDIVVDLFANDISKINWSMTQINTFKVISELESKADDKIKYRILEITIQKFIQDITLDESVKKKRKRENITKFIFNQNISKEKAILRTIIRAINIVAIDIKKSIFESQIISFDESIAFNIFIIFSNVTLSLLHDNFSVSTTLIVKRLRRAYQFQQQNTLAQFNLLSSHFEYDKNYSKKIIEEREEFEAVLKIDDFIHVMLQFKGGTSLSSLNKENEVSFEEAMNNTILVEYAHDEISDEQTINSQDIWSSFEFSFSFSLLELRDFHFSFSLLEIEFLHHFQRFSFLARSMTLFEIVVVLIFITIDDVFLFFAFDFYHFFTSVSKKSWTLFQEWNTRRRKLNTKKQSIWLTCSQFDDQNIFSRLLRFLVLLIPRMSFHLFCVLSCFSFRFQSNTCFVFCRFFHFVFNRFFRVDVFLFDFWFFSCFLLSALRSFSHMLSSLW